MPLYYFNIYNHDANLDEEGGEPADDHAARAFAVKAARSLAADTVQHGHLIGHHRIEFVDADQQPIGEVRYDEAVEIRPGSNRLFRTPRAGSTGMGSDRAIKQLHSPQRVPRNSCWGRGRVR